MKADFAYFTSIFKGITLCNCKQIYFDNFTPTAHFVLVTFYYSWTLSLKQPKLFMY